jgi:hypothetical protein
MLQATTKSATRASSAAMPAAVSRGMSRASVVAAPRTAAQAAARASTVLAQRRMASVIARASATAPSTVDGYGTEKTSNPLPIVFVSAEVRQAGLF